MNTFIKLLLLFIFLLSTLSSCSTALVQTERLNKAENLISEAEQALSNPSGSYNMQLIKNNLDTANAYLSTLTDYKKFLTITELKRFKELKERSTVLMQALRLS